MKTQIRAFCNEVPTRNESSTDNNVDVFALIMEKLHLSFNKFLRHFFSITSWSFTAFFNIHLKYSEESFINYVYSKGGMGRGQKMSTILNKHLKFFLNPISCQRGFWSLDSHGKLCHFDQKGPAGLKSSWQFVVRSWPRLDFIFSTIDY